MIKKIIFSILFTISLQLVVAQTTEWVMSHGDYQSEKGISIGADSLGFIYISGFFNNDITFGSITLLASSSSTSNKDMFVAKMDSTGNYIWAVSGGGGPFDDRALGMHVTPGGEVYLTGTFWGSITFPSVSGGQTANGNGHDTSLMAKIDTDGNCVWARGFGASPSGNCPWPIYDGDDHSYDVKVDKDDNIYVTGFFSGNSASFDGFTLNNPNWVSCQPSGYVGKMDSNGDFLWVEKFDGIKDQRGSRDNRIALDNLNNVYVVGGFENTGVYGPISLVSNGEWDAFLFKMDNDGNFLWAKNVGSNKSDRANGIAIDYCDNIYISGEYRNPMVFTDANASNGTDTLSHKQKRDIFVAKATTNGDWVWAKRARSNGVDKPYQMSVDENMQVFVAGSAGDSLKFNNNIILSNGDTSINAFVAQIDGSGVGDWVWAKLGGGLTDNDRAGDICEDGGSNVYAVGFYEGAGSFDGNNFTAQGKKDVFVWKLKKDETVSITPSNCIYIDVQPPGSGTVIVDSKPMLNYPMLLSVADSVSIAFDANEATGFEFVSWDWANHTAAPSLTSPNTIVYTFTSDTLIAYFQTIPVDTITYIVQPPGSGTINVDATNITTFPDTSIYNSLTTSSLTATANAGYTFSDWDFDNNTPMPNTTNSNISVTWSSSDTCYVNFAVIPVDTITYIVQPPGSGTITVDAANISTFPNTNNYNSGTTSSLTATPNFGYNFSNWDFDNNTPTPNATSSNVSVTWTSSDTCFVNFSLIPNYNITYLTFPVGAGSIDINSINVSGFPLTQSYQQGTNISLVANENPNYTFSNWINASNTLLPNTSSDMVDFTVMANDTIIANYLEVDTLWIVTKPAGVATLNVASDMISTSPYMGLYQKGSVLNIEAFPNGSNVFNQWNLNDNTLPDYNTSTLFTFLNSDTLFAYFNNVLAIENLGEDLSSVQVYPSFVENQLTLEMLPNDFTSIQVDLLNIAGQKVQDLYSGDLKANLKMEQNFNIDQATGIYFIRIVSDKTNAVFKIIKK